MFWSHISAVVIAFGVAASGEAAVGNPHRPPSIAVMVVNEAAVPAPVLADAEMEAARAYQRVGVQLEWVNGAGEAREYDFTIKIVANALSSNEVDTSALGVAPGTHGAGGKMAYAFYGRIREFSEIHRVAIGPILGSVIAHELGHLLLPHHRHSQAGLMSSGWDAEQAVLAAKGLLIFSATESTLIRNRVPVYSMAMVR